MAARRFTEDDFLYPESDHMPRAESDLHRRVMTDLIARLEARYAGDPNVYVSGDIRVYNEEWNPYDVHVPDCFVVFGVPKRDREMYQGWQEGRLPNVVVEITSKETRMDDQLSKFGAYQDDWRVEELFLFDPAGDYLRPRLAGYRRSRGKLRPIRPVNRVLTSEVLGINLAREGTKLVLRDAATGRKLLTALEAEVARLQAELAALRRQQPPR